MWLIFLLAFLLKFHQGNVVAPPSDQSNKLESFICTFNNSSFSTEKSPSLPIHQHVQLYIAPIKMSKHLRHPQIQYSVQCTVILKNFTKTIYGNISLVRLRCLKVADGLGGKSNPFKGKTYLSLPTNGCLVGAQRKLLTV